MPNLYIFSDFLSKMKNDWLMDLKKVLSDIGNVICDIENELVFGPTFLPNEVSYKKVSHIIL